MKGRLLFILVVLVLISTLSIWAQNSGDYRSKNSGNWSDASTWEIYDGSAWVDASNAPTGASDTTITIQSGHTVTVASAVTINSGCNVVVDGYLKSISGITGPTSAPLSFTFNNGSTYEHAMVGGAIPMSTWNTGSTCLITGITGASPGNNTQNFYNFTWNCTGQTTNLNLGWDNITIGGNLIVISTGSPTSYQFRLTNAATTRTITINGDVIVNGGTLTVSGSSGAAQYNVTVKGNIVLNGGTLNLCSGSGGFGTWRLWGNLTLNGGTFATPSNTTVNTRLIFAGGGTQYYTRNSGTNNNLSYGVENGTAVILNSPLTVGNATLGGLVLTNGKFVTTSINLITLEAGVRLYSTFANNVGVGIADVSASTYGYVDGPLAFKVAATTKVDTIPIGRGAYYRPTILTLNHDGTTSTTYNAEMIYETPPSRTIPSGLDAVNSKWYLRIVKGSGANVTSATIKMSYGTDDDSVGTASLIRIAKDDGAGNWVNLGGSGSANNVGTIISDVFTSLTTNDFVIAHVDPTSLPVLATLTTNPITKISTIFATGGGNITNSGNATITTRGICWSTSTNPDTNNSKTSDGTGSGPFTSSITELTPGQTYYVRAYAVNSAGVAYGDEVSFTTLSELTAPIVATNAVINIVNKTATGSGAISAWGGSEITDRGVCWSVTNSNPTIDNCDEYNSIGAGDVGTFSVPIGVSAYGTTYYVRAYAINSTGTGYGDAVSFTSPTAQPDVYKIVDKNGTVGVNCDYTTVQAAFDAVPNNYTGRWIIYVKNGVYYEKTWLTRYKMNVVLIGESVENTILTFDDYAGKNTVTVFAEGTIVSNGTNTSFTCAIDAPDFEAQNITFQNTANAYAPGSTATQAVALRTNGDRQEYYNCRMLGYQDTYYTQGGITGPDRIYNKDCYIEGSVDYIFGRDVAVFDNCTLYTNRGGGVVTAASTEVGYSYGYVFLNCTLDSPPLGSTATANGQAMTPFYLGRPWQQSPKTVYLNCYMPATVHSAGWTTMGPAPSLYSEYNCTGPGAVSSRSVIWTATNQPSTITAEQAATYTLANIFSKNNKGSGFNYPSNWMPSKEIVDYGMLPVEMSLFTASVSGVNAKLRWSTATETNNYGFEVERRSISKNTDWQKIAFVPGAGTSNSITSYSFEDKNLSNGRYEYRFKQIDNFGAFKYSASIEVEIVGVPMQFTLSEAYPNPFNPSTKMQFTVETNGLATLKIYNILGQQVATLFSENAVAGNLYEVNFEAKSLASGIYFARLESNDKVKMTKLVLMK